MSSDSSLLYPLYPDSHGGFVTPPAYKRHRVSLAPMTPLESRDYADYVPPPSLSVFPRPPPGDCTDLMSHSRDSMNIYLTTLGK